MFYSKIYSRYSAKTLSLDSVVKAKVEQLESMYNFYKVLSGDSMDGESQLLRYRTDLALLYLAELSQYIESFSYFDENFKRAFAKHYFITEYKYHRLPRYTQYLIILSVDLAGVPDFNPKEILNNLKKLKANQDPHYQSLMSEYFSAQEVRENWDKREKDYFDHEEYLKQVA